jgi:hypothetical protein
MNPNSDRWERFLDPEVVRPSLFLATMFIATFEILKNSVIDRIRDFYTNGFDQTGPIVGPDYKRTVVSRNESILRASLDWLREHDVIDHRDLETFERLKKVRDQLAHRLFDVVTGQTESDHEVQFEVLVELLRKIEVWWVVNVEISTDPEYDDGQEIDVAGIVPEAILLLQMLIQVATGNTELLEAWRKARTGRNTDA